MISATPVELVPPGGPVRCGGSRLDGADTGGLVGAGELDELGVVVDVRLLGQERSEIADRIAGLGQFAVQLDHLHTVLQDTPAPPECRTDLSCRVPESPAGPIAIELTPHATHRAAVGLGDPAG